MNLRQALISQGPSLELQRAAQAEIARLDAVLFALRREITHPLAVEYSDKIIHPCNGPSHQCWKVSLWLPDPLPDPYSRTDFEKPRLTPEQAYNRWLASIPK